MNLYLITGVGSALIAGFAAWEFQDSRYTAELSALQLEYSKAQVRAQEKAKAEQSAITKRYEEAINEARTREISLRRDIDSARSESDGLRELSADAARKLANAPAPAVLEFAVAVNDLFNDCQRTYQDLAGKADQHSSDLRTLIQAWPVNPVLPEPRQ